MTEQTAVKSIYGMMATCGVLACLSLVLHFALPGSVETAVAQESAAFPSQRTDFSALADAKPAAKPAPKPQPVAKPVAPVKPAAKPVAVTPRPKPAPKPAAKPKPTPKPTAATAAGQLPAWQPNAIVGFKTSKRYYMPDYKHYDVYRKSSVAVFFKTEADAKRAGYTKASVSGSSSSKSSTSKATTTSSASVNRSKPATTTQANKPNQPSGPLTAWRPGAVIGLKSSKRYVLPGDVRYERFKKSSNAVFFRNQAEAKKAKYRKMPAPPK